MRISPGRLLALASVTAGVSLAAPCARAQAQGASTQVTAAPGRGLTVRDADDRFAINLRARVQLRDTVTFAAGEVTNEVALRTARLWVTGHVLTPDLRYGLQLALGAGDFEPGNPSPVFDAFVEWSRWRDLRVRAGQFFVPFDRARTIREFGLQFVDRQQVVRELSLDRDVGLMLSSDDLFGLGGRLGYALFVGGGDGRNRFGGQRMGPLVTARVVVRPFGTFDDDMEGDLTRDARPRLAVGVAGGYNVATTRAQSTYGATYTLGDVDMLHAAVDLTLKWRGLSLLAEGLYRQASVDALEGTVDGRARREGTRSGWGYLAQAGVMVGRYVELVARWEQLFAAAGADPSLAQSVARQGTQAEGGVNVYLNGHALKLQAGYARLWGDDPATATQHARLQLDASF